MSSKLAKTLGTLIVLSSLSVPSGVFAASVPSALTGATQIQVLTSDDLPLANVLVATSNSVNNTNNPQLTSATGTYLVDGVLTTQYAQQTPTTTTSTTTPDSSTVLDFDAGASILYFNQAVFNELTSASQSSILDAFVQNLQKSQVSQQGQQNIISAMGGADQNIQQDMVPLMMKGTSANLYTAMQIVTPFLPMVSVLLGILAFVIMFMLMLSTAVDLAFMGLPIFREGIINRYENGAGAVKGKGAAKKKIPFISHDAEWAVRETESSSSAEYRNVFLLYFKRRAITYIILSICVLYLVVGEMGGVVTWLLHLAQGTIQSSTGS